MPKREDIKNTDGYKRIMNIKGVEDISGPIQEKNGAFEFYQKARYDSASYGITMKGKVQRTGTGTPYHMADCDMKTLTSYNNAFNIIADKMIEIKEFKKKEEDRKKEKKRKNGELIQDIIEGKPVGSAAKRRNIIKRAFQLNEKNYFDRSSNEQVLAYAFVVASDDVLKQEVRWNSDATEEEIEELASKNGLQLFYLFKR